MTKPNIHRKAAGTVYGLTEAELFRLTSAYAAIRDPTIRAEFLRTVEAWANDQWDGTDRDAGR